MLNKRQIKPQFTSNSVDNSRKSHTKYIYKPPFGILKRNKTLYIKYYTFECTSIHHTEQAHGLNKNGTAGSLNTTIQGGYNSITTSVFRALVCLLNWKQTSVRTMKVHDISSCHYWYSRTLRNIWKLILISRVQMQHFTWLQPKD